MTKIIFSSTILWMLLSFSSYSQNAALDLSFDIDGIALTNAQGGDDGAVSTAIQSDGKIVVVGFSFNGTDNDFAVVRYNTDGSLDNTFGTDGKVTTDINGNDYCASVAIQSDGKIVVVGGNNAPNSQVLVVRYNTDGTLDNTFDNDGIVMTATPTNPSVASVAIQSNGKIVVAGGYFPLLVFRYNTDGSLDTSFDLDGKVFCSHGTISWGRDVKIQTNGKIVVAGGFYHHVAASYSYYSSLIVRFETNGAIDMTFGSNGFVEIGPDDYNGLVIDDNDKIVATGYFYNGTYRYNPNGSFNQSFQNISIATSNAGTKDIALQNDGKMVVIGSINNAHIVLRYDTTGTIDSSFNAIGYVTLLDASLNCVTIQNDGKIIVVGQKTSAALDQDFAVYRFNTDGTLDTSFDGDGMVNTDIGKASFFNIAMAQQPDGKIVTLSTRSDYLYAYLYRYNVDGSLDNTFGNNGKTLVNIRFGTFAEKATNASVLTSDNGARSIAIQADGKIVVVGYKNNPGSTQYAAIARYNSDGTPDNSFGNNGITNISSSSNNNYGNAITVQSDGKLVVTGSMIGSYHHQFMTVRYLSDGSLDSGFGTNGIVVTNTNNSSEHNIGRSILIQADGKIVVGGYTYSSLSNYDFTLVRYNTNGSLDNTFNGTGIVHTILGNNDDFLYSLILQANQKIVAVGASRSATNSDFVILRYNTNGTLDNTFSGDGKLIQSIENGHDIARSVVLDGNNKIIVAGTSTNNSNTNISLVRLNTDGSLDNSFYSDGIVINDFGKDNGYAILMQPDSKLVIGGSIQDSSNSYSNGALIRLLDTYIGIQRLATAPLTFYAYPNPTNDNITIEFDANFSDLEYQLINNLGQIVGYGKINSATTTISLESLESGVYYISISGDAKGVQKVIKA